MEHFSLWIVVGKYIKGTLELIKKELERLEKLKSEKKQDDELEGEDGENNEQDDEVNSDYNDRFMEQ